MAAAWEQVDEREHSRRPGEDRKDTNKKVGRKIWEVLDGARSSATQSGTTWAREGTPERKSGKVLTPQPAEAFGGNSERMCQM